MRIVGVAMSLSGGVNNLIVPKVSDAKFVAEGAHSLDDAVADRAYFVR